LTVGDLVVGYESSPRRRLVALARVSKSFGVHEENEPRSFELTPVCLFSDGVEYSTIIADEVLARSEPMRNRNQGTLFELSELESDHLFKLLASDHAAQKWLQREGA
jgi:5-methylcytosine-specific restriction protein B